MSDKIQKEVIEMIARNLGMDVQDVTPDQHILDDLGADSLDVIEMIMEAEEDYGIEIDDAEAEKVETVQDAIDLIARLTS